MELFINDSTIDPTGQTFNTLQNLYGHVIGNHIPQGEVITGILIDEDAVNIGDKDRAIGEAKIIKLTTANLYLLADSGLDNLTDHMKKLTPMLEQAGSNFRTRGEEEANKFYLECLNSIKLFSDLIDGVSQMLSLNYEDIPLSDGNLRDKIIKIQKILEGMETAQTKKDWIDLADILEYELVPEFKSWIEFLPQVREGIKKRGGLS